MASKVTEIASKDNQLEARRQSILLRHPPRHPLIVDPQQADFASRAER
jgi:hypothetical protein